LKLIRVNFLKIYTYFFTYHCHTKIKSLSAFGNHYLITQEVEGNIKSCSWWIKI